MILWRIKSNNYDVASARYRVAYPAWLLFERYGIDSRLVGGRTSGRMLGAGGAGPASAIVFSKHFSRADIALARNAKARGMRVFYDQCDNLFAKSHRSRRDNPENVRDALDLLDGLVFPTEALRDVFIEHGFPAARCHVVPDAMITGDDECAALAWTETRMCFYPRLAPLPARRGWTKPAPAPADVALPPKTAARLVWYGAVGSKFGHTGVSLLADIIPDLNAVAATRPIELLLVTSDPEPCAAAMAGARFPWHFAPWSVPACFAAIRSADACLLPAGDDAFSQTKSANRVLMALANGVPTITSSHPSIDGFGDAFFIPEPGAGWAAAITAALDAAGDSDRMAASRRHVAATFGHEAIAAAWLALLAPDRAGDTAAKSA